MAKQFQISFNALEFLDNNKRYFQNHTLEYLPEEFIERIGELKISKRINSHTLVIEKAKEQYSLVRDQMKTIVDDVQMEIYRHVMSMQSKNGFHVHYIFSKSTIVPKGWSKVAKEKERKLIQRGLIHKRHYKGEFHCIMQVSESEGFMIFPNNDGFTDPRTVFYSQDKKFKKWCSDLFDFFWGKSNTFVMSRINEGS